MALNNLFKSFGFTETDLRRLSDYGITDHGLSQRLNNYKRGFPSLDINRPATSGDGVLTLEDDIINELGRNYARDLSHWEVCKFVPASGAASRMFQDLVWHLQHGDDAEIAQKFLDELPRLALYQDLAKSLDSAGSSIDQLIATKDYTKVLHHLTEEMAIQDLPKALIPFHRTSTGSRTAFDEHLTEAVAYARSEDRILVHFTVSSGHLSTFENYLKKIREGFSQRHQLSLEVSYSIQHPSTDMVAIGSDNRVIRDVDGSVWLRPGGHGALLRNLNEIQADLIFIKNIDNVMPEHLQDPMIAYKQALGGLLLFHQQKVFRYLMDIEAGKIEVSGVAELIRYIEMYLGTRFDSAFHSLNFGQQLERLFDTLNRPLRVCSVIKANQPTGGGPFWVGQSNGQQSLQIVEHAQLSAAQTQLESSYAHITDLVCAVRNYKGEKFDLSQYSDATTGFITSKWYRGTMIQAQEWPGLWNGSMAYWNTILLEVPGSIFHPVKTIWDLLSDGHQSVNQRSA